MGFAALYTNLHFKTDELPVLYSSSYKENFSIYKENQNANPLLSLHVLLRNVLIEWCESRHEYEVHDGQGLVSPVDDESVVVDGANGVC